MYIYIYIVYIVYIIYNINTYIYTHRDKTEKQMTMITLYLNTTGEMK